MLEEIDVLLAAWVFDDDVRSVGVGLGKVSPVVLLFALIKCLFVCSFNCVFSVCF